MTDLVLPLKKVYFHQIKNGEKTEEYRLCTPYWNKRLADNFNQFDRIVLTLGYPARDDHDRRLIRPWRGYTIKTITHPHFGPDPVRVYAINVERP
ncbi:RNA-binding protein [Acidovorax sp. SUPP1855]|uniref:ASCH domain-containing protein n=1 Tax=Acidovorax sp. SUPP1855 TaxID=431774 RepID=UPI0023DE348A|nr:ASCH domain-containing protein [Acidovorax sp. SUPP1855]GKS85826.1 RNA-binding protein [Acidovorax sp. SUPP1855]